MPVKLVEVIRGKTVESIHRGDIAVVSLKDDILYELGDSERLTFFRSSSKPFQAIASLESGITEKFDIEQKEIALMASSHSGEEEHINVIKGFMEKVGIAEEALICGSHEPINREAALELITSGTKPTMLHCNCSAKHVGILAACKIKGYELKDYNRYDHPIQKDIDKVISDFTGIAESEIVKGIDGCNIPVHAVSLRNMAYSYANLTNYKFMDGKYEKSQKSLIASMIAFPEMVAGKGRLDTELMKLLKGKVIAKIGAEGVYCASIPSKNIGISIKIEDGNSRALGPVILETLLQLNIISSEEIEVLRNFWRPEVLNHYGEKSGEIKAKFKIKS